MNYDSLYNVQWRFVQQVAFGWLDRLDKIKGTQPAQVVTASAITFLLVCKRFGLDPRRVLETADRVVRRARDVDPRYVRAIEQYLKEELADR